MTVRGGPYTIDSGQLVFVSGTSTPMVSDPDLDLTYTRCGSGFPNSL